MNLRLKFDDALRWSARTVTPPTRYVSGNDVAYDQMELVVAGPGAANRLFLIYGILRSPVGGNENTSHQILECHLGPTLRSEQVHGIMTSASLAGVFWQAELSSQLHGFTDNIGAGWHIENAETQFDNAAGRLLLRVVVMLSAFQRISTDSFVGKIAFQVALRAQV